MWFVDAIFEYVELKEAFFQPEIKDMVNDAYLGLCVVALGLVIWVVRLLIADPKGSVRRALQGNREREGDQVTESAVKKEQV